MSQQQPPYGAQQQPQGDQPAPPVQPTGQQPYGQAWPQQQVAQPYFAPGYPVVPPTNVLAIIAIAIVWVVNIGGIVLGHIALAQIKRTGEDGRGLALTALIVGYVSLGLVISFFAVYFVIFALVFAAAASSGGFSS